MRFSRLAVMAGPLKKSDTVQHHNIHNAMLLLYFVCLFQATACQTALTWTASP